MVLGKERKREGRPGTKKQVCNYLLALYITSRTVKRQLGDCLHTTELGRPLAPTH